MIDKENSMSMEIIKQLYDIDTLFEKAEDISLVKKIFSRFAKTELSYRDNKATIEDVLEDIYQTSLCITMRGNDGNGNFDELLSGMKKVSGFIFSENYHIEKTITSASKAAYLATIIKYNTEIVEKYKNPLQIKDWTISAPLNNKLNKLKKSNLEAFFYWYKIFEIKTQNI
jgi:hypothetical protein